MRKAITVVLVIVLTVSMVIGMTACGVDPRRKEVQDRITEVSVEFNEIGTLINENIDLFEENTVAELNEMSDLLSEYNESLFGDTEYTEEQYDDIMTWLDAVELWMETIKEMAGDVVGE